MSEPRASHLSLYAVEHPWGHDLAVAAFEKADGAAFAQAGHSRDAELLVVLANWEPLDSKGMLAAALIEALTASNVNNARYPVKVLERLLQRYCNEHDNGWADLRARGDDPGYSDPERTVKLYRGVCGIGRARRVRGLSWTSDLDVACWFALRYAGGAMTADEARDPAVYAATVRLGDVWCFTNRRAESEYIVRPARARRVPIAPEAMRLRYKAFAAGLRAKEKRRIDGAGQARSLDGPGCPGDATGG